jgi:Trypsin-co-occurring domain 2
MASKDGFNLSDLIVHTANEIRAAHEKKDPASQDVMQFSSCELEIAVTVKVEAGGGFKFWLAEATAKASGENVSKIKLSFGALPGNAIAFQAADENEPGPPAPQKTR